MVRTIEKRIARSVYLPLDLDKAVRKEAKRLHKKGWSQNDVIIQWLRDATESVFEGARATRHPIVKVTQEAQK